MDGQAVLRDGLDEDIVERHELIFASLQGSNKLQPTPKIVAKLYELYNLLNVCWAVQN